MIRSLWIAKTGLDAQQTQMDTIANNLANVSTSGFKRSRAVFEDLLYQNMRQPGAQTSQQTQLPSGLQDGTVSVTQAGTVSMTQVGQLQLATFMNAAGLESRGENLYVETVASGNASTTTPGTNGAGMITQGYVETSNVNVAEELVNMIQT